MNIQEIKEKISELTEGSKSIKLPYHMVEEALKVTKDKSDLDLGIINYPNIQFFKVLAGVEILLNHLGLEYDTPMTDEGLIDSYQMYEDFVDLYDSEIYKTFYMFEDLLQKEIELAERSYIQLGTTEGRMVGMLEKLTDNLGVIVDIIGDDKKLDKKFKIIKKHFPNFDKLIGEFNKIKIAEFMEKVSNGFGRNKNKEVVENVEE